MIPPIRSTRTSRPTPAISFRQTLATAWGAYYSFRYQGGFRGHDEFTVGSYSAFADESSPDAPGLRYGADLYLTYTPGRGDPPVRGLMYWIQVINWPGGTGRPPARSTTPDTPTPSTPRMRPPPRSSSPRTPASRTRQEKTSSTSSAASNGAGRRPPPRNHPHNEPSYPVGAGRPHRCHLSIRHRTGPGPAGRYARQSLGNWAPQRWPRPTSCRPSDHPGSNESHSPVTGLPAPLGPR